MEMEESSQNKQKTASFHKEQGNKFFNLNEFNQAIQCYTLAIQANPLNSVFYCNRAFCYLKLQKYNQCINDCSMAIEYDPYNHKAYYRRMIAYESIKNYLEAFNDSTKLLFLAKGKEEGDAKKQYDRYLNHLKNTGYSLFIFIAISEMISFIYFIFLCFSDYAPVSNVKSNSHDKFSATKTDFNRLGINFVPKPQKQRLNVFINLQFYIFLRFLKQFFFLFQEQFKIVDITACT